MGKFPHGAKRKQSVRALVVAKCGAGPRSTGSSISAQPGRPADWRSAPDNRPALWSFVQGNRVAVAEGAPTADANRWALSAVKMEPVKIAVMARWHQSVTG